MAFKPFLLTITDANGNAASGAKAYTYTKDTTTPLAVYTDSGLGTPTANPYVANAGGQFEFYLDNSLSYTILIKDSAGAITLFEVDSVADSDTFLIVQDATASSVATADTLFGWDSDGNPQAYTVTLARTLLGLATGDDVTFATLTTTGNISPGGTVDGRDIAADGVILDALNAGTISGLTGITLGDNKIIVGTGTETIEQKTVTDFALTVLDDTTASAMRTTLGLGTAAVKATGTSGNTVPLLDGANTWSAAQTFSATSTVANADPSNYLQETDASTDNQRWRTAAVSEAFIIQAVTDAGTGGTSIFKATRTDQNIDAFRFGPDSSPWVIIDSTGVDGRDIAADGLVLDALNDATLLAIGGLTLSDNSIIRGTGTDTVELVTLSDFGATMIDDADADAVRTTIGLDSVHLAEFSGAVGDAVRGTDGAVTATATAFTSAGAAFVAGDVGKTITIAGAGTAGAAHVTTIAARVSGTALTLTDAAVTTVSGAIYYLGTNDTSALTTLQALGEPIQTKPGYYFSPTLYAANLGGLWTGRGNIVTRAGQSGELVLGGNVAITTAPLTDPDSTEFGDMFTGDNTRQILPVDARFTGSTTLGQPTSGFKNNRHLSPIAIRLYNTSGYNHNTDGDDGRTTISAISLDAQNIGQGGVLPIRVSNYANQTKAGATSFLASPSAAGGNFSTSAGADGVYLNPMEVNCDSQGFDVAAVGYVANMVRDDASRTIGDEIWHGVRVQSLGSESIDSFFIGTNGANVGVDFTRADFGTDLAAFAVQGNDRFYGDASSASFWGADDFGTAWFRYGLTNSGWEFAPNDTVRLRIQDTQVSAIGVPLLVIRSDTTAALFKIQNAAATDFASVGNLDFIGSGALEAARINVLRRGASGTGGRINVQARSGGAMVNMLQLDGETGGMVLTNNGTAPTGSFKGGGTLNMAGALYINGTEVLSGQMSTVSDPAGGATVDTEARAQLAALIDALQAVGLMA